MKHDIFLGLLISWESLRTIVASTWVLDPFWPKELAQCNASWYSALALDENNVLHVSARIGPAPVCMFDDTGTFLGSWGTNCIMYNATSKNWGGHGLKSQKVFKQGKYSTRFWVADILEHTVKAFDFMNEDPTLVALSGLKGLVLNDLFTSLFTHDHVF
jgi:hypothetical protein